MGTIMSYCDSTNLCGVSFALGFGPIPRQRMIDRINSTTCTTICSEPEPTPNPTSLPTPTPTKTPTKTINLSPNPTQTQTKTPTLTKTPTVTQTKTPTNTINSNTTPTPTITNTSTNFTQIPKVDFVSTHWYNGPDSNQFIIDITSIIDLYNKPVWITEFAAQTVEESILEPNKYTQLEINNFINTVIPWMNTNPMIERFAWRDSTVGTSSLFLINGQLTETGTVYRDAQ